MTTTYETNGIRFIKDLVFGWTVLEGSQFFPINQMDAEQIKIMENIGSFPAYVPDEFRGEIRARKAKLLAEQEKKDSVEKTEPTPAAKTARTEPSSTPWEENLQRSGDRIKLLNEILEKMRPTGPKQLDSDLTYGVVSRRINDADVLLVWSFTPTNGGSLPKQIFGSVDDLVTWVLKKFW